MAYTTQNRKDEINMQLKKAREIADKNLSSENGISDIIAIAMCSPSHYPETKWMQYVVAAGRIEIDEYDRLHFQLPSPQQMENKYIANKGHDIKFFPVYDRNSGEERGVFYTGLKNNKRGMGLRGEAAESVYQRFGTFWKNKEEIKAFRKGIVDYIEESRNKFYNIEEDKKMERSAMKEKIRARLSAEIHNLVPNSELILRKMADLNYITNSLSNMDGISNAVFDALKEDVPKIMTNDDPNSLAMRIEEKLREMQKKELEKEALEHMIDQMLEDRDLISYRAMRNAEKIEEKMNQHGEWDKDSIKKFFDKVDDSILVEVANAFSDFRREIDELYNVVHWGNKEEETLAEEAVKNGLDNMVDNLILKGVDEKVIADAMLNEMEILKDKMRDEIVLKAMDYKIHHIGLSQGMLDTIEEAHKEMQKEYEMRYGINENSHYESAEIPDGFSNSLIDKYGGLREGDGHNYDERD